MSFKFVLEDLRPSVIVSNDDELAGNAQRTINEPSQRTVWLTTEEYEELLSDVEVGDHQASSGNAEDAVLLLYTAAFDGRPNGALLSSMNIFVQDLALARVRSLDYQYCYLSCGPLFHIATMAYMLATFHLGGKNVARQGCRPSGDLRSCRQRGLQGRIHCRTDDLEDCGPQPRCEVRPKEPQPAARQPRMERNDHDPVCSSGRLRPD